MAEFSGIPPVGINSIVRPAPEAPPPAVPVVEASLKGGGLSGRMSSDSRNAASSGEHRRAEPGRADQDQLAGPSPAFQASILELELDLQNTIARVEAARGKRESDLAGVTTGTKGEKAASTRETAEPAVPDTAEDAVTTDGLRASGALQSTASVDGTEPAAD